ncbi:neurexin-4-like protein [Leptotrombidium deliense]|uniref:Neurexin-4-like protein n=1 Tax=Leptotrombidium deliense TaxID=299467 RepID=A0A443SK08_9ACAR|nr:neurexin-4-like protein [Leptotrombidium deliense]
MRTGDCYNELLKGAKLSASSQLSDDRSPKDAIIHGEQIDGGNAWTAAQSDFGQYLLIDLGKKHNITAIATAGKQFTSEFVQEYRLDYGNDGQDFSNYRDRNGNIKV